MAKPTVHDIAREAGVSLATVDRVLNGRPGVRANTIERVNDAVRSLGYVRDTYAANLARKTQYRFAFVLPDGDSQFVDTLKLALKEAMAAQLADRVFVKVVPVQVQDPHSVVRALNSLSAEHYDGVAIMAPETPQVRDAVARLKEAGLSVVALVSDLPTSGRDHFVGINNLSAGRTAGDLMGRFVGAIPGKVLIVTNSMLSRDSIERRLGFDEVMSERFDHLTILPTIESRGDPARMEAILLKAALAHPDLRGVYSMGPGNRPLIGALRRSGRIAELTVIVHELTPLTHQGLIDYEVDAVITQNVGHLVRSAMRVLRAKCDGVAIYEAQERIRIDIVLKENLPT
ncbi:substrate-binding domain-containing protein [Pseudooceanicola sp. 216_PA32_1]|uniref:Substrate-binding domain-containing protein n=1 Tax=Pseudooceanicola pacificus TaxID=2676438 RepID=A0A844WE67_9RHOB|nr:LacI family DNA-binding transcriptional regulator [Pseudooceanicola pacificus]MWB77239.1 substrate-binding domain-containing protein [Pseudooceanicola pacificus]